MIGTRLADRYEVVGELGRGGMGVVYRARDPVLDREVAIKLLPPSLLTSEAEERLQREARVVAKMDHPGIVAIHDLGRHEGSIFLVMPVVEGSSLRAAMRSGSLVLGDVVETGLQIAEALDYSHARGVVHRDIKPENVMVSRPEAGSIRARVMDFGLARSRTQQKLTGTGMLVGTLAYLSPEQLVSSEVDGRADIYALGTLLYECVAGEPPFSGDNQQLLYRIAHEDAQSPRSLGADVDPELDALILSCLAKNPARRPQRAGEVAEGLRRYRGKLDTAARSRHVSVLTTSQQVRPALSPLIGREEPFSELQRRLNLALAGEGQFAVVSGEAGIGRGRLLAELERLAGARDIRVLHGRFVEQDEAFAYQGFGDVIQDHFRTADRLGSAAERLDFSDLAADLVALFPVLSEVPELRSGSVGRSRLEAAGEALKAENRTHVFEILARALVRIAGSRPLVLILESLHTADASVDALQYVVRRLGSTSTLVVGSYRSNEVDRRHPLARMLDAFHGDPRFVAIQLQPFTLEEHRQLLESVLGGAQLAGDLVERIYQAAEGNPFFTMELVRSLLHSGAIAQDESGVWRLVGGGVSAEGLPKTIQQAVEKRIERLPQSLREVLELASVLGRSFESRDLEAISDVDDLDGALDRLIAEGLLEEERESRGDRLAFASGMVRDVLYAGLSRRKRRSLHRRSGEQLEKRHGSRLDKVYPQLFYHFAAADVDDKTVLYGLKLARRSLDAFSSEDALRSLKAVLECMEEGDWEGERVVEGDTRLLLAEAHRLTGDAERALEQARAAAEIFRSIGDAERTARAALQGAETAWRWRRTEETRDWIQGGLESARAAGRPEVLAPLLELAATVANLRGEYVQAGDYAREAERLRAAQTGAAAEEGVPPGGRLVVALTSPIAAREPAEIAIAEEEEVLLNVFEPLIGTDAEGNLLPSLCERWEALEDGRVFRLTLRDGIRFHDGTVLSAVHVKASLERLIRHASSELRGACASIEGARELQTGNQAEASGLRVLSERVIELRLRETLPIFPALLTVSETAVILEASDGSTSGTGPFRIASQGSDRVVLERHPGYWRGSPALLDAIEFRAARSASDIAHGLRQGEVDLGRDLLPKDLEEALRDPRFREGLVEVPRKNLYFVMFNTGSPAVGRAEVRRALSGVVRTHDLVWRTLGRYALPAVGLVPPGILGHDPGRRRRGLDREQAVAALQESGVSLPLRLRAAVHPVLQDRYGSLTRALLQAWAELSVEVEMVTRDMEAFLAAFEVNEGLDLMIGRYNVDYSDPDNFTHGFFHSATGVLSAWYTSPETDRLAEQARVETRSAVRESFYRSFEEHVLEAAAVIPLFHDVDYRIASPRVRRLRLKSSPPYVNYHELGKVEGTAPVALAPVAGGVVHVPIGGQVRSLDPALAWVLEENETMLCVFETLVRDARTRIVPWLAEFGAEEGGRRYRFRLREGVRFHDGRRLTARDVRYSFERLMLTEQSPYRTLLWPVRGAIDLVEGRSRDLAGFQILSSREFTIDLDEPVAFFPALLTYSNAAIIPEGSQASGADWRSGCAGTGPFRLSRFEPGSLIEMERNPAYWRSGVPKSEGLVFHLGMSPETILPEFRAGRLSLAAELFPQDVEALRRDPDFASSYRESPRLTTYLAALNVHQGPCADADVRRALAAAVDIDALVPRALGRLAVPAHGVIPPGLLGFDPSHTRAGARSSSGNVVPRLPAPVELTVAAHPTLRGGYSALTQELTRALEAIGARLKLVTETQEGYLQAVSHGTVDVALGRWNGDYPDPDTFAHGLFHSAEGFLGSFCGSPEIDALATRARTEMDPSARHLLYRRLEELLAREVRVLPLFHEQVYRFARPEIEGLEVSFSYPTVAYENLSVRR